MVTLEVQIGLRCVSIPFQHFEWKLLLCYIMYKQIQRRVHW